MLACGKHTEIQVDEIFDFGRRGCKKTCKLRTIPQSWLTPCQLPEGELAAGQEKPAWAVTQGSLRRMEFDKLKFAEGNDTEHNHDA